MDFPYSNCAYLIHPNCSAHHSKQVLQSLMKAPQTFLQHSKFWQIIGRGKIIQNSWVFIQLVFDI